MTNNAAAWCSLRFKINLTLWLSSATTASTALISSPSAFAAGLENPVSLRMRSSSTSASPTHGLRLLHCDHSCGGPTGIQQNRTKLENQQRKHALTDTLGATTKHTSECKGSRNGLIKAAWLETTPQDQRLQEWALEKKKERFEKDGKRATSWEREENGWTQNKRVYPKNKASL